MLTVDVAIPVYGQWELTADLLDAFRAHRDRCVRKIIVADDASPDDTRQRLQARADVTACIHERNRGFSAACNTAARASDADAIFFLNNDTVVPPGTIDRLAHTMETTGAAAVGPMLLNADGSLQACGLAMLDGRTHVERLYAYLDATLPAAHVAYEPVALSGAALLVRRDAFVAVAGFDEGYRNGSEDVDLCLRLWAAGHRCRYEPQAVVVHLEGASRGKLTDTTPNDRRLRERWDRRVSDVPRLREPPAAVLELRWHARDVLETTLLHAFRPSLRAHAGAPVVVGPLAARFRAAVERRGHVAIAHDDIRPASIVWDRVDERSAPDLAARNARRYLVPSHAAGALLVAAGVDATRVSVVRPAFGPPPPRPAGQIARATIVYGDEERGQRDALRVALAPLAIDEIDVRSLDMAGVEALRTASIVVFAGRGDAWGLAGSAALSGGAAVVALRNEPFLEVMPSGAVLVDTPGDVALAAAQVRDAPDHYVALGARAARDRTRALPELHPGRQIRELARALTHGVIEPQRLTMTDVALSPLRSPH